MIPERDAMLRAILEHPHDDVYRLAFADWCEGSEPELAEFVRVQGEIARMDQEERCGDCGSLRGAQIHHRECSYFAWRRREEELIVTPAVVEMRKLPYGIAGRRDCTRGFVSHITLTLADFMKHAEAIFMAQPVTMVTLLNVRPFMQPSPFIQSSPPYEWDAMWVTRGFNGPWDLPEALFDHLPKKVFPFNQYTDAITPEDAAHAALSAACVSYARQLAGLPPLEAVTV